jgi:hypothetical protein
MVWILFMLGTYLYRRDSKKEATLNATDEEKTDYESSSMEMVDVGERGEKGDNIKVEVIHIEEKS